MSQGSLPSPTAPSTPTSEPGRLEAPPQTGDLVIDAALADLGSTEPGDLDTLIVAGDQVQRTLQARLTDLGS